MLLIIAPSLSFANTLCPNAKTTREIADCLIIQVQQAEQDMEQYLNAALNKYNKNAEIIESIKVSQEEWSKYQKAHCKGVYQKWGRGSMRLISHPTCLLYTTKSRTYDIWREFLTYGDSTPPLLPKPELLLYAK